MTQQSITCPECGMTSYNPNDIEHGWCGKCERQTSVVVVEMPADFVDQGYRAAFGTTKDEAKGQRVCVSCKQHPTFTTEAGRREYEISGMCEPCFDGLFPPDDEET